MSTLKYNLILIMIFLQYASAAHALDYRWGIKNNDVVSFQKAMAHLEKTGTIPKKYTRHITDKSTLELIEIAKSAYTDRQYDATLLRKLIKRNYESIYSIIELQEGKKRNTEEERANEFDIQLTKWLNHKLNDTQESEFLKKYARTLKKAHYKKKIDGLLLIGLYNNAKKLLPHTTSVHMKLARARIAINLNEPNMQQYLNDVPESLLNNGELLYDRIAYRKRNKRHDEAIEMLLSLKKAPESYVHKIWELRKFYTRELIYEAAYKHRKLYRKAYILISQHCLKEGTVDYADAEWLSGWVALKFLQKPELAYVHFSNLYRNVKRPISISRGAYWKGRAAEAQGDYQESFKNYQEAAKYPTTFYGQISALKINKNVGIHMQPISVTEENINNYYKSKINKFYYLALQLQSKKLAMHLVSIALNETRNKGEIAIIIKTALQMKAPEVALVGAKAADNMGVTIEDALYPTHYINSSGEVDAALKMSIIKQESGFDHQAVSRAGALGLMQLMPHTAEQTASKAGINYTQQLLTTNPHYNIKLGSSHIKQMLDHYKGSLFLALSSYNAGMHNVEKWINNLGDPSGLQLDDKIDWIESIPFAETRNYVQRVIENMHVYTHIINKKQNSIIESILHDINLLL